MFVSSPQSFSSEQSLVSQLASSNVQHAGAYTANCFYRVTEIAIFKEFGMYVITLGLPEFVLLLWKIDRGIWA